MRGRTLLTGTTEVCARLRATLVCLLCCGSILVGAGPVSATIPAGISCSSCHTMHNSQDGNPVFADGPRESLLNNDCIGCHSGSNDGGVYPYVFSATTGAPVYGDTGTESDTTTLAGGSFYWVAQAGGDSRGHNVRGLAAADGTLTTPPGFGGGLPSADGTTVGTDWASNQLTCAGTYGCHGTHDTTSQVQAIKGGHHRGASGAVVPGSSPTAVDSYRMLVGIAGYEDPDREFRPDAANHNQYKGVDGQTANDKDTISYLCAQCHGQFHQASQISQTGSSPWLRHPTDFDMANSGSSEYELYNGGTGQNNIYSVVTPVASAGVNAVLSTVTPATADDNTIITCISCHRAHGTPYYKSMRWDYANSIGGACTNCHTSKN